MKWKLKKWHARKDVLFFILGIKKSKFVLHVKYSLRQYKKLPGLLLGAGRGRLSTALVVKGEGSSPWYASAILLSCLVLTSSFLKVRTPPPLIDLKLIPPLLILSSVQPPLNPKWIDTIKWKRLRQRRQVRP